MEYKNIIDMHSHSSLSFDGNDSCALLCESAVKKGAKYLAITDHLDIDGAQLNALEFCEEQFIETQRAKNEFNNKLTVLQGLEIGQGIYRKELTEQVLNSFDYDFILGSIHNLENMEDFYFLDYKAFDVYVLLTRYFEDLYKLCTWGAFDSLAHLTYPLRYIVAREKINVDLSKFSDITDAILECLAENDKALEINTSGLFMEMKDTLPSADFVKRFKAAGGKYVTIGSDSHYADKICQGVEYGLKTAYDSGFRDVVIFKKRQPFLISIE